MYTKKKISFEKINKAIYAAFLGNCLPASVNVWFWETKKRKRNEGEKADYINVPLIHLIFDFSANVNKKHRN